MKFKLLLILLLTTFSMMSQNKEEEKKETSFDKVLNLSEDGIGTTYNDGKDAVKTVYKDVKEFGPKIENALEALGKNLKTSSEQLWKILVKQQRVYSFYYLIIFIFSIISWFHFYYRFDRAQKDKNKHDKMKPSNLIMASVCLLLSLTLSIVTLVVFKDMLTGFINPEYGAIKTIVETARSLN